MCPTLRRAKPYRSGPERHVVRRVGVAGAHEQLHVDNDRSLAVISREQVTPPGRRYYATAYHVSEWHAEIDGRFTRRGEERLRGPALPYKPAQAGELGLIPAHTGSVVAEIVVERHLRQRAEVVIANGE